MKSLFERALDRYHNDYLGVKINVYDTSEIVLSDLTECESNMHGRFISNWCLLYCKSKWYIIPTPGKLPNLVYFENKIEATLFRLFHE